MGGRKEEEDGGYQEGYRGNYYGRNTSNWRDRQYYHRDKNQNSNPAKENPPIPRLPEKRPDESEFEKTVREFVIAQKASNDFVKNQFYNLKTKVKQGQKNHQAAIQDLKTKFGRISDHQSSNTQTKQKPLISNEKPYRPSLAQNEHVNAVFIRSDFVILQMEEDDRVPLILGRSFLHTSDAIIRVKNKELNLGIGEDRATFHIDKAMQHSYVNDDTCFRMDVIDEITEDELDDLLDNSKPFLNTSEKISETLLDKEFKEFMSGNVQEDEVKDDFEELPSKNELRIRTSIQDPPTDLEMKPLPKHLEYAFLAENSLLPVVISALLEQNEKERLVSVLKNHKEAFA
uniref:Reverse transcriptase domain-containing protein n=1 Tax=Tanacetum cinerariifolium TaxID=118510 RepID=A0A6L2P124_TANCI|nr:reverse transcriptase domain-containing protein [Tanacetum cinerariifolium]